MIEQVLLHVPPEAVGARRRHRVILVEVERDDAGVVDLAGAVAADQLLIDPEGGAAGGEPEHAAALRRRFAADHLDDPVREQRGEVVVVGDDDGAQPLALA